MRLRADATRTCGRAKQEAPAAPIRKLRKESRSCWIAAQAIAASTLQLVDRPSTIELLKTRDMWLTLRVCHQSPVSSAVHCFSDLGEQKHELKIHLSHI